jgi:putative heme-binding domain-containing protein
LQIASQTNKPGPGPGGAHVFLDGEEAIQKMTVHRGLKVSLFASEKEFPELINPVQMSFDSKGRLWVAVWPTYPHWMPKEPMNDKLLVFEDSNGDGKADKVSTFADGLHCPTGFEFYNGGVLVAQAPDLMFLKDTDGDGKADERIRLLHGLCSADTHHTANSFAFDPGGALYFQEGTFHHSQVETPYGPPVRCANAGVFRYEPRTQKFEVYVTFGFANPHGHVFDRWGQDIIIDGTGANPYHGALFSGFLPFPAKHARPPQVYPQRTRPCPGIELLSSRHFPESMQGNLLVANVIGFQGILQYRLEDKGASFAGTELEPILSSSDPNFRPADLKIGPDGALWFVDWQNQIIGHMQHNLRDPSRDRRHGRIYRVTCADRALLTPPAISGQSISRLLDLLRQPEDRVRYRARIELGSRDTDAVMADLKNWLDQLDKNDPDFEHHRLEALWLCQSHNVVNIDLLKRVLGSSDFRARAAAARVLCYWRDRVPDALEIFKRLASDSHPRVRLEAVRAASFFQVPEAIEVPLISAAQPSDPYLDYTRAETMKALDPIVKKAIAGGVPIPLTSPAGMRYFLRNVASDDLLKMKRSQAVYREMLFRTGIREEFRREALAGLAQLENKSELRVLLEAISNPDSGGRSPEPGEETVVFDLVRLLTSRPREELAQARGELEKLALAGPTPVTRQLGFVALVAADGQPDRAWSLALKSPATLYDLVHAMPLVGDPGQRAALYPKVEKLLGGLPKELPAAGSAAAPRARFVRIELLGKQRTLTLAEVEVYSDGQNIARQGKASQKNTAFGGEAARAIDGNKSGSYADGGQTHTQEGTQDPWWELDLGGEFPIDAVVVFNRTDGNLGNRLRNFDLKLLDARRKVVFEKAGLPAPETSLRIEVGGGSPERPIRAAAMIALTSVRGKETETFRALAPFLRDDSQRHAAVRAIQRIPTAYWPKEEARPLLEVLLAHVRQVPVAERTSPAVLDTMQLADSLASLLPLADARRVRQELGELGVRVIRIGTVVEQMRYDQERIAVEAGRPVEIILDNNDLMPHNLVITEPGALEEIGNQAEMTATQPGAAERHYVPVSRKVLVASRLLQPRESQRIRFTAPSKPGVYPIVCTYPGHWRRMYGAMYVVDDLDDYLAGPEAYLAKHPLPIADELLKFVRPRTEWKFDDLASSIDELRGGRSFANGRQLFQVASCVSCHKMGGVGTELGPDLTRLDPKLKPVDILRDVLEPSHKINEKFQTFVFETRAGKLITGLVIEETPERVKVIENPLVKAEPIILKKADIAERQKSPVSIMPKGLLDKLTREEILDLMAYVLSGGNEKHPLFQAGHGHHGH